MPITDFGSFVAPSSEASTSTDSVSSPHKFETTPYPPEKDLPPPYPLSSSGAVHADGPSCRNMDLRARRLHKSNYPPNPPSSSGPLYGAGPSNRDTNFGPILQKSNRLEITRNDSGIKGSWLIDTDLPVPPSLLAPMDDGMERPNLLLHSRKGSIDAQVELCAAQSKERAALVMGSRHGSITCRLRNPLGQKIDLRCSSRKGGEVHVYLHRGFTGPIKIITGKGSISFSSEIRNMMTTFSERDGTRLSFLGPFEGSGFTGEEDEWKGDRIHAESKNGSVKICYLDEEMSSSCRSGSKGFWSRVFA